MQDSSLELQVLCFCQGRQSIPIAHQYLERDNVCPVSKSILFFIIESWQFSIGWQGEEGQGMLVSTLIVKMGLRSFGGGEKRGATAIQWVKATVAANQYSKISCPPQTNNASHLKYQWCQRQKVLQGCGCGSVIEVCAQHDQDPELNPQHSLTILHHKNPV